MNETVDYSNDYVDNDDDAKHVTFKAVVEPLQFDGEGHDRVSE